MRPDRTSLTRLVTGNNGFAVDLYRQLSKAQGNLFCSPFSLSSALAMTFAGARGNTADQMAQTLHFDLDDEALHAAFAQLQASLVAAQRPGQVQLALANSIWPQIGYPFLPEFLALLQRFYGVSITPVDYATATEAARQAINTWAEQHTAGKIKDLLEPGILDALTRLVLVNAIYFKGIWLYQFDPARTAEARFWLTASEHVTAPLMQQTCRLPYAEVDDIQVLSLPYADDALSMVVLLPAREKGLAGLDALFTAERLDHWLLGLREREREVQVFLPRFKISSTLRLDATLQALGMTDAFDDMIADFSGMDGIPRWLYIAAAVQKAWVQVNEEGTEAAAATAVVMNFRCVSEPPPVFRADHPFVFLIMDHATRSILFCGRVVDPSGAE